MQHTDRPIANPTIVLREEFDEWALLFDPDTAEVFGLNPVSVFIWKKLDGKHTADDILGDLKKSCDGVPDDAKNHVEDFMQSLVEKGFAGYEVKRG